MSDLYNEISEALFEVIESIDEKKKKKKGGKKDACYHKVRSRYKVWPSAYASGALVKCRKVGAANWGNKSKKKNENLDYVRQVIREELEAVLKEAIDMNSPDIILMRRRNELSNEDIFVLVGNRLMKIYRDKVSYEVFLMDMRRKPGKFGSVNSKEFAVLWQNFNQNRSEYTPEFMIDGRQIVPKNTLQEKKKKRKKAGTESSKESSLRDWFGRKGAKGKRKGWVDCNAPDGKGGYKSCGRSSGEGREKYPACRPTPGACKERGKGKSWGKKSAKKKKE